MNHTYTCMYVQIPYVQKDTGKEISHIEKQRCTVILSFPLIALCHLLAQNLKYLHVSTNTSIHNEFVTFSVFCLRERMFETFEVAWKFCFGQYCTQNFHALHAFVPKTKQVLASFTLTILWKPVIQLYGSRIILLKNKAHWAKNIRPVTGWMCDWSFHTSHECWKRG